MSSPRWSFARTTTKSTRLYEQVYRELLTFMLADPTVIRRATYLLWAAHNLERIADRTTNIAENVIYMVTGRRHGEVTTPAG